MKPRGFRAPPDTDAGISGHAIPITTVAVHRAAEKTIPALGKWCGGPNLDFRSRAGGPRRNPTALDRIVWHEKRKKACAYR
jgi:hypothetical protein